jgi:hypothetical protein
MEKLFDFSKYQLDPILIDRIIAATHHPNIVMALSVTIAEGMEGLLKEIRYKLSDAYQKEVFDCWAPIFRSYGVLDDTIRRFTKEYTFFTLKQAVIRVFDDLQEEYEI